MIRLPPGVTINYEVTVVVNELGSEFLAWWQEVGGTIDESNSHYTHNPRGQVVIVPTIRYGQGRWSHRMAGGGEYLIRFRAEDASVALMLLMKWTDIVVSHNIKEVEKYVY